MTDTLRDQPHLNKHAETRCATPSYNHSCNDDDDDGNDDDDDNTRSYQKTQHAILLIKTRCLPSFTLLAMLFSPPIAASAITCYYH
jgi:hypothetical protein